MRCWYKCFGVMKKSDENIIKTFVTNGNEYDLFALPHKQIANELYAVLPLVLKKIRYDRTKDL